MAAIDGLDLYELLGIRRDATDDEIKRAYRKKARELHPDANGGDPAAEAQFKEVSLAYEVLRDPERRARYDRYGPEGVFGQGPPGMTFDFEAGLSDIFEAFFGSMGTRTTRRGPTPGADAEVGMRLSLIEAAFGAHKDISVRLPVACGTCGGSGAEPGTHPITCPDCQGAGETRRIRQSLLGQVVTTVACARCQGVGELTPTFEYYTDGSMSAFVKYYLRALSVYGFKKEAQRLARDLDEAFAYGVFDGGNGSGAEFHSWEGMCNGYEGTLIIIFGTLYAVAIEQGVLAPFDPEWWPAAG